MTLDPAKLLAFTIPRPRQQVSRDQVALYALSIGLGQDPLDPRQRDFVDPVGPLKVMPSMALVLAHPGFWLGDPRSGVDASGVLHADQSIELHAPLPVEGTVTSSSTITGLVDKGPGKAALLRTETVIEDGRGTLLARLRRTTFLRGGGGFGGNDEKTTEAKPLPARAPDHVVELAVRPEQALLYRLNGDLNPLHSDVETARRAGFDRPILHGLCTMGMVCHALLRALADYDEQRLRTMRLRFKGVVFPGETLRTEIWNDGSFRTRVVERDTIVVDQGQATVAQGWAGAEAANQDAVAAPQ
ncbi:MAG: 3-alpha,7-alpha, 12-alpha-trihydroxy-5-beta-cholest-24-enoyl-CoA hydratase [Bradyrhizobium sp.]|nr:3-alpha,7-alpha, 12-alpha-trihydroxy-5-beta-cholest-24-enoyl-CoA hydratase [Bradyrhizobium sp.]